MSRPISAIARYAACGGAGAAAYDCAVNEGSMLSHVIHQLVTSASSPPAGTFASSSDYAGSALHRLELADLSAKLDRLTSISMGSFAASRGTRVSLGALLCAAGAVFGGLAVWAIATGRWWPTIQAKLELVEQAIGLVDAKVDARASELSAQLTEQHAQVMSAVSLVSESVYELDGKLCKVERRIDDIDDTTKENNSGIKILCEVVATNFDLRQCPAPVLKRLHDYSGSGSELVESRPPVRAVQTAPAQVDRQVSTPTLMDYLRAPSSDSGGRAAC